MVYSSLGFDKWIGLIIHNYNQDTEQLHYSLNSFMLTLHIQSFPPSPNPDNYWSLLYPHSFIMLACLVEEGQQLQQAYNFSAFPWILVQTLLPGSIDVYLALWWRVLVSLIYTHIIKIRDSGTGMSFSSSSLVPSFPFCPLLYIQLPFLTASGTAFLDLRGLAISVLLIVLCPALYSCHSQGFEGFVVAVHQCSKGHNVYCPSANSLRLLFCWRDKEKGSR